MHAIGLISGCLVQVISPLDCSSVFLLVLVPLFIKESKFPALQELT